VNRADQHAINSFGRLNTRMHELEEELKEKSSQHELLDDAANEIILADDDEPIRRRRPRACLPNQAPIARVGTGMRSASATLSATRIRQTSCSRSRRTRSPRR